MLILLKGENDEENKKISLLIVVFCLVFICIVALSACDTNALNDVLNKNGNQQEDDASQNENNKNDSDTEENADENDNQSGGEVMKMKEIPEDIIYIIQSDTTIVKHSPQTKATSGTMTKMAKLPFGKIL